MTNGEKLCFDFPNTTTKIKFEKEGFRYIEVKQNDKWIADFHIDWWEAEYKEPTNTIDYRRAFEIACDLLNGDIFYGVDKDKIYELKMQKDEVVSSSSYEEYILNYLQDLDRGQYASESTTKNDLGVDCISREQALNEFCIYNSYDSIGVDKVRSYLKALPSVTLQKQRKGHWVVQPSNKEQGERDFIWWKCSECGQVIFSETLHDRLKFHAFCSRCGADMREVEE